LVAIARGGQVALSAATQRLVQDALPPDAFLQDLGLHRLRDLRRPEQVFQLLHPDLPSDFPPLKSQEPSYHNLPVELTPLIGREREIEHLKHLLPNAPLVTLTGTDGCGKTRLAIQVASDLLKPFADGVCFVDLSPIKDVDLVVSTIAQGLG